jgi:hypothetical protein
MSPIPEPASMAAMTDHVDRPAVITRPGKRGSHRHLEQTIDQLAINHLEEVEIERNLNTIGHLGPPCFRRFVTNRK